MVKPLLLLVIFTQSACYLSFEAGVGTAISGPVKQSLGTSLGVSAGFAYDFERVFAATGGSIHIQEFERENGDKDKIAQAGPQLRLDVTLLQSDGFKFDKVLRATAAMRVGGCRAVTPVGMEEADCDQKADDTSKTLMFQGGLTAGFRSVLGDTLTVSVTPYYLRSDANMQPSVGIAGVIGRITISGMPKALLGLATLNEHYDREASRRDRERAAARNRARRRVMDCNGHFVGGKCTPY